MRLPAWCVGLVVALASSASLRAEPESSVQSDLKWLRERVMQLEDEVDDLRRAQADQEQTRELAPAPSSEPASSGAHDAGLLSRARASGNADFGFERADRHAPGSEGGFAVQNARLFLDVDLETGERSAPSFLGSPSLYFEWDFVRESELKNKPGSLYVRLDRLAQQRWLNLKLGRMPVPFGEEYLRFSEERPDNPFLSFSAGAPYQWDEGVLLFGSFGDARLSYLLAAMDGDDPMAVNSDSAPAWVGKLSFDPESWLHVSLSGIHTGSLGSDDLEAKSALEFGGTHAVPFGELGGVQAFQDGVAVAADPVRTLDGLEGWEGDVILSWPELGRLWLSYGGAAVNGAGASSYDRDFRYGLAELVLELARLSPALERVYLGGRYSAIGTFDRNEGYVFEAENGGDDLGFNTRSAKVSQVVLGYRLRERFTFKLEYSHYDFDLIRGVDSTLLEAARKRDRWGAGFSLGF